MFTAKKVVSFILVCVLAFVCMTTSAFAATEAVEVVSAQNDSLVSDVSATSDLTASEVPNSENFTVTITSEDGEEYSFTSNGEPMTWYVSNVTRNGFPSPIQAYGGCTIYNGYTAFFNSSTGENFTIEAGKTVTFKVTFTSKALFTMGWTKFSSKSSTSNGTVTSYYTTPSAKKTHKISTQFTTFGYYHFWVTNYSSETKELSSASVNFS